MAKRHRITLTDDERRHLKDLVARRSAKAEPVKRALILLAADETDGAPALTDAEISERYHVSTRTTERLRERAVEHGLTVALDGLRRGPPNPPRKFDGEVEARLVALRRSDPPEGRTGWSMRLLADRLVALDVVDSISHESVRQILNQTRSRRGASASG